MLKVNYYITIIKVIGLYIFVYFINTSEIPGFFLLLKHHMIIFIVHSEDTIFIFHM